MAKASGKLIDFLEIWADALEAAVDGNVDKAEKLEDKLDQWEFGSLRERDVMSRITGAHASIMIGMTEAIDSLMSEDDDDDDEYEEDEPLLN